MNFQDVLRDVHDPENHALKTSDSGATIFAVVNTGAAGVGNSIVTVANVVSTTFSGNVTLDAGSLTGITGALPEGANYIGLASVNVANIARTITGNLTLSDAKTYIGLTTSTIGNNPVLGAGVNGIGFATVNVANSLSLVGNVTISDSKTYIGLTTATIGNNPVLGAGVNGIGFSTVNVVNLARTITGNLTISSGSISLVGNVTISDSKGYIGLVTVTQASSARSITGNVTLSDAKTFIGLTTTTLGASPAFVGIVTIANSNIRSIAGNVTLSNPNTYIGLTTSTLGVGTQFIGLVTAWTRSAGTSKTLIHKNIAFAQASVVTIAVPSNTFKVTHLLINSNATVRINIKSGVTYLTGNVSLGVNLNPGGGWVENGSDNSPVYVGLAGAAALVVEKFDSGSVAQIGGKVIYFDEA